MKLSTYIERLVERGWRREAAEEAAILAKEAGATWDPEEPELPERIYAAFRTLRIEGGPDTHVENCSSDVVREAAARYNAVASFLARYNFNEAGLTPAARAVVQVLRRDLAEERERLQWRKGTLIVDPKVFR